MRLMDGYLTTQLLHVAAELGVAEVLEGGPLHAADVAERVGAQPGPLGRVLRGLAAEGVLDEDGAGRFSLTPVGACLPALRGAALVRGRLYHRAASGMLDAVRDGGTAFDRAYGEGFFAHLDRHADARATFQGSMAARSEQEASDVVAAYDFSGFGRLVDVGGGTGVLLAAILRSAPELRGVLVDLEEVVEMARPRLAAAGVGDRVDLVGDDFFTEIPAGADLYVLSRVLHDWDDADAARILATCRRATPPGSRLLVVEALLPERAADGPAVIRMDLHMLLLFGTRERTAAEYRALLQGTGFTTRRVVPTASPAGLGVIEAAPA
jgi:SAM-dependent methyltransferase